MFVDSIEYSIGVLFPLFLIFLFTSSWITKDAPEYLDCPSYSDSPLPSGVLRRDASQFGSHVFVDRILFAIIQVKTQRLLE